MPYPEDLARHFVGLLGEAGHEVLSAQSRGIFTAEQVGRLADAEVRELVRAADHPDAEAILVPDTALHTVRVIAALEEAVGKPVLTANQVSVWEALRLRGLASPRDGAGALFALAVA